jgi:hypothetical protein
VKVQVRILLLLKIQKLHNLCSVYQ